MLLPEVAQQIVVVKVALITKLTAWMSFVRAIVVVACPPMLTKLCSSVRLPINCEQLQLTHTDVPDFYYSIKGRSHIRCAGLRCALLCCAVRELAAVRCAGMRCASTSNYVYFNGTVHTYACAELVETFFCFY